MAPKQPPEISLPPKPGKPGGLGEKLEISLVRFAGRILNSARDTLAGILRFALDTFLEGIEPFLIRAYRPLLGQVRNAAGCPSELKSVIDLALSGESQAGAAVLGFLGTSIGGATVGTVVPTLLAPLSRSLNAQHRPQRPDIATLIALRFRGDISETAFGTAVAETGWPSDFTVWLQNLVRPRLDPSGMAANAFRTGKDLESLRSELNKRGYEKGDVDAILTILKPIPGAGDLIRMAVREAWNDSVASRYGYDEDFPGEFASWLSKQGFDPEWAKRWWRAHWEIPGPTMGMEMLHRTDMTEADYATLLKIADYPAKFRKWMTEVAYAPYTRVDIRRMYQVGVITTYEELVRAHMDIGYKRDKAEKLSDFTVLEYGESEKEATRAEVVSAYQLGRLTPSEAKGYLDAMGYPGWVVEMYLARADLSRSNSLASSQIGHAKTMYVNGQMSATDVYSALAKVNLPAAEVERYLEEWEISRTSKVARPTRADLLRFFLQNEMTEAEFRTELAGFRLSARYIDWYVADAKRKLVLQAQDELEKADAEALKVRSAAEKTAYDIKAADIAVQIAQMNLTIADLKASVTAEMTYEDMERMSELIVESGLQIKNLQLQKAQVWAAYLREKKETQSA